MDTVDPSPILIDRYFLAAFRQSVRATLGASASEHPLWAPGACAQRSCHAQHHSLWRHHLCSDPGCRKRRPWAACLVYQWRASVSRA